MPAEVDPLSHADWCRSIARRAAREFRVCGWQEVDDLTQTGLVKVLELAPRFAPPPEADGSPCSDPGSAFRGWAYRWVRTAVRREAERLGNGGTYRRRDADRKPLRAVPLSAHRTPAGDPIEVMDPRSADTEEPEPAAPRRRPTPAELAAAVGAALAAAGVPATVTGTAGELTVWSGDPRASAVARTLLAGVPVRVRVLDPAVFAA